MTDQKRHVMLMVDLLGAASVAALPYLLESGQIGSEERIVCVLSGAGFKDQRLAADRVAAVAHQSTVPFDAVVIATQIAAGNRQE